MLKITVVSPVAKVITWGDKGERKAGQMRVQEVYLHTVAEDGTASPFPEKTEVVLNRAKLDQQTGQILTPEQAPYPPGEYQLHPSSVYIDRAGRLGLSLRLVASGKRG
jgi:hypothetical protein